MCLIIDNFVRKDKIKYIYKLFNLQEGRLYSYFQWMEYHFGLNYPCKPYKPLFKNKSDVSVGEGGLHFYTSLNMVKRKKNLLAIVSYEIVAIRLPLNKKDVIYYGNDSDIMLNKVIIPKTLYYRVVNSRKPNMTLRNKIKVYW